MSQETLNLPIGISDYRKLREGHYYFVDKSLFIRDIVANGAEVILLTRPRRFGKTINLSMLYYFLDSINGCDSSTLFTGTAIAEQQAFCQQYQNKVPVISLSFKEVKKTSAAAALATIETVIANVYKQHRYLLHEKVLYADEKEKIQAIIEERAKRVHLEESLQALCEYLQRVFHCKPYVLLDEYDTPISAAYVHGYYPEMASLMRALLGSTFKDNSALGKAVVTGITRIAQESIFSGINNIQVFSLLHSQYGDYFGFTHQEVTQLLAKFQRLPKLQEVKQWYNGYQVGPHTLYNPWSILNYLSEDCGFKAYWLNTSDNILIRTLISNAKVNVKQQLQQLLQNEVIEQAIDENLVFPELNKQEAALWSLLVYSGYLNVVHTQARGSRLMATMRIPNAEVKIVYERIVEYWFSESLTLSTYDHMLRSLVTADFDTFTAIVTDYLSQAGSYFDFNSHTAEQVFHSFILGLVVGLKDDYLIVSNQEAGYGRFDVALVPHDRQRNGIVLEFKVAPQAEALVSTAEAALAQIKDKKYTDIFLRHQVSNAQAIGLAFFGKQLQLRSEALYLAAPP